VSEVELLTKLRGFSPRANHTDRAAAAGTIIGRNKSEVGKEREAASSSVEPRPTCASKIKLI